MRSLTDKQKSQLWEQTRNVNFQASRRLEGAAIPLVTLTAEQAAGASCRDQEAP